MTIYSIKDQQTEIQQIKLEVPNLKEMDLISTQLKELFCIRNLKKSDGLVEANNFIQSNPSYGSWVYYPWNSTAIRILEKTEFIELRTARNRNKITEIEKLDYIDVIKKYDSKETFFYVDPPYMNKEKYYINHDFTPDSHSELAKVLNNIKGRFILSYFYFDGLKELYPNCKIEKKFTIMGTEYIIMNY
jgi:site-specific DNA-adenine methylase